MTDPWGLTPRQQVVLDAVCEHGGNKAAARALDQSVATINNHLAIARDKMGVRSRLLGLLAWDRWRRATREPADGPPQTEPPAG